MDHSLHPLFRPIQMNGTDRNTYYIEQIPSISLMAHVACYWESGSIPHTGEQDQEPISVPARVLPDGCTDMLITYDSVRSAHSYVYCGNYTHPFAVPEAFDVSPSADYTFGVRFFPGGAYVFHGLPLEGFTDMRIPLEECWPVRLNELQERIAGTRIFEERVQVMNAYLSPLSVQTNTYENDLMKNALHRIFIDGGRMSVSELAMREVVSERQLHRKFAEWIGISPKRFSEVVRFHRVLGSIHQGHTADGVALALNHGFFDQAHLIRQFRKFYGETPLTAAKEHQQRLSDLYNKSVAPSDILRS
ncbi:helix-turn-helix domain-containing protein [Paenibacillus sp. AD87]|uniref:helix-turn-helix domain-containing protein n=1 Tax=Paenibacillus sp. AD87 TaxID=1528787 RepID=UPI0007E336E1|nr:helix-turn-helix domain-containing protein [Paenibacillus sp. AD87]OAX50495.1 HTH-type transcriptional activator RhaS [Paenibacillus sp. AD87]